MHRFRQILPVLCGLGLLAGCHAAPPPASRPAAEARITGTYHLGAAAFDLAEANVLQTWPIIEHKTPLRFARIALQMPPDALVAGLPADAGRIQIDILAPQENAAADRLLAATFTDWAGRETRLAGTRYHYDPRSPLQEDGGRAVYVRHAAAGSGLEALLPLDPRGKAPAFFLHRGGASIDAAIDCHMDVPPSSGTGEYCSLRRQVGGDYGYRVFFPRILLDHWAEIDAAARDYLAKAAAHGT